MRKIQQRAQWNGLMALSTWEDKATFAARLGYEPHSAQLELHSNPARFKVPCCGRRFGKSKACAFETLYCAIMGGWVMNAAPTYNLANKVWLEATMMLKGSEFSSLIDDIATQEGKQIVRLSTGGIFAAKSTDNPRSLVGDGWDLCVFDEAALEPSAEPWRRSIRPALADRKGSAIFPSTPQGENWYKDLYDMGQIGRYKDWWSMSYPSTANPLMTAEEVASMCEGMSPEFINQEIYAMFLGSGGGVFKTFHEVCTATWQEEPIKGHNYYAGLDVGKTNDYTVLVIWDGTLNCVAHIIKINLLPYPQIEKIIQDALWLWQCPTLVDKTREASVADHIADTCWFVRVDGFNFTNDSKNKIVSQLNIAFDEHTAGLLDDQTELGLESYREFAAYRYERLASGLLRMSCPNGKHDDIVMATCLAYESCMRHAGVSSAAIYRPGDKPQALNPKANFAYNISTGANLGVGKKQRFKLF